MNPTANITCFYHGKGCRDGFMAAAIFWCNHRGKPVDYIAMDYYEKPEFFPTGKVFLVDFCFQDIEVMQELIDTAEHVTVIDHHKGAMETLQTLRELYGEDKLSIRFNLERSGCGLVWDYFCPDKYTPFPVLWTEDRDLWRFHYSGTRAFNEGLTVYPKTFAAWAELFTNKHQREEVIRLGEVELTRLEMRCAKSLQNGLQTVKLQTPLDYPKSKGGELIVPCCRAERPSDASRLTEYMIERLGVDIVTCWWDDPKGRRFRLNTLRDHVDLIPIAKRYGGGGHPTSAGFMVPFNHPLVDVTNRQ